MLDITNLICASCRTDDSPRWYEVNLTAVNPPQILCEKCLHEANSLGLTVTVIAVYDRFGKGYAEQVDEMALDPRMNPDAKRAVFHRELKEMYRK